MQAEIRLGKRRWQGVLVALLLFFATWAAAQSSSRSSDGPQSGRVIVVSLQDRRLAVVQDDTTIASFDVAVGTAESPSPTGEFRIVNRVTNPTYYHPGSVIPSGKSNPIGTRWLGLNLKGYGIHGTNAPGSIGKAASHGCIRLRNRDIERLFSLVRIGDRVEIHGERDETVARVFGTEEQQAVASLKLPEESGGQ